METVKNRIKTHEGFRSKVYKDTLNKRTVGYGHLCVEDWWEDDKEYTQAELERIFDKDFDKAEDGMKRLCDEFKCSEIKQEAKDIITEMVFQLGQTGVKKFKNMWKHLSKLEYSLAKIEMLDSRWAKQTPNRAKELSNIMGEII